MFTDEEFAEYFGTPARDNDEPRRTPIWARLIGAIAALAMLAGTITILVDAIGDFASINDAGEIREAALDRVDESPWGFLVSEVIIVPIPEPRIGAFVTNNPPDGIVQIDLRPWSPDRLDRLVDHEIGHLVDFAVWGRAPAAERRGGLSTAAWAECAAVAAGTRQIDTVVVEGEYHCYADEAVVHDAEMASITEICTRWGERICSTQRLGADGTN